MTGPFAGLSAAGISPFQTIKSEFMMRMPFAQECAHRNVNCGELGEPLRAWRFFWNDDGLPTERGLVLADRCDGKLMAY